LQIAVDNDSSIDRGVVTTSGQTTIRDIIASNAPKLPVDYAYGSDGALPSESDTALGNLLTTTPLDEVLAQSADTSSEWNSITDVGTKTDSPIAVVNGELLLAQSGFFGETETFGSDGIIFSEAEASNGQARQYATGGDSFSFDLEYTIPEDDVGWAMRYRIPSGSTSAEITLQIDNQTVESILAGIFDGRNTYQWYNSGFWSNGDLNAGNHTVGYELGANGDDIIIDCIIAYDQRTNRTFDNTVDANGYLSGPELYPINESQAIFAATTQRFMSGARIAQTWNNTSNDQQIQLTNTETNNTFTADNSQTLTATFAQDTQEVTSSVRLSRYGSRTTATPTTGYLGQAIDMHELFGDIRSITADDIGVLIAQAIVDAGVVTNETIREAGQKASDGTLLTHTLTSEFKVLTNQSVLSSERVQIAQD
jgi:hypothetical protein